MTIVFYILPFVEKRDVAHFVFTQSHKKKVYVSKNKWESVESYVSQSGQCVPGFYDERTHIGGSNLYLTTHE
jgi:hypothetical protein